MFGAVVFILLAAAPADAQQAAPPAEDAFTQTVRPILARHCFDCHEADDKPESGLNLTSVERVRRGALSGPVLVPGHGDQSLLVQVLGKDSQPHMPPEKQLSPEDIAAITKWIDGLPPAELPGPVITAADREHWAFRPIARPALPPVRDRAWPQSPVDYFILSRLEEAGLKPSPPAEKADLVRRLYFDLIGLSPEPAEVEAFLADDAPDAYERLVDALLSSPRYGERWGRHWLDLARYADSSGYHSDGDRPNAWRYRDYVIGSFNQDKPLAQFIREQLAGDEVLPGEPQGLIATGFCRNGPTNEDNMGKGPDLEKYRMDELDDVISTTGTVFLGLTIGCARCHDHKYDPLPQRDYYRLLAVFNSSVKKDVSFTGQIDAKGKPVGPAAMALVDAGPEARPTRLLWRGDVKNPGPLVEPGVPEVLAATPVDFAMHASASSTGRRTALADWIAADDNPLTWRVMANRLWQFHFGQGLVATPGNFGHSGEPPSHPQLLDWLARELAESGGSLKQLHRVLVTSAAYRQSSVYSAAGFRLDPDNVLLWRMNKRRLEAEPLRDAVLAVSGLLNLEMCGPGIKPRIRPDLLVASQRNKWPLVEREGPEHWRRSVYIYIKRQLQMPLMELFDAPNAAQSCARRDESLVPTQALVLMNDDSIREQAARFAARIGREAGPEPRTQAELAMYLAWSRPPASARVDEAAEFLARQRRLHEDAGQSADQAAALALVDFCHVLVNTSQFLYVD